MGWSSEISHLPSAPPCHSEESTPLRTLVVLPNVDRGDEIRHDHLSRIRDLFFFITNWD